VRNIAVSKNNVPIRMNYERWHHISTGHPEIADYYYEILETIENPKFIYKGNFDSLIAVGTKIEHTDKFIVVVYKEIDNSDGFIITAYISSKEQKFEKKKVIWEQQK
jgi:hypothetical protein